MAENKTKPTGASVAGYIASRASEQQAADCRQLMALLRKVTRKSPRMWGPSIVGYDRYSYTYESGHSGEAPVIGFAIRGRETVLYLMPGEPTLKALLSRLGRHRMGKGCLYFRQLADLDLQVLEQLVTTSVEAVESRYGHESEARN